MMNLVGKRFSHFRGGLYEVICVACHTETGQRLIIYQPMEGEEKIWARPEENFFEEVEVGGLVVKRFSPMGNLPSIDDITGILK